MPSIDELLTTALSRQNEMWGMTAPLRTQGVSALQSILQGGPTSAHPAYAPARQAIEGQYNTTAKMIGNSMPRGGQLNAELADLMGKRAGAVVDLEGKVRLDALNKALGLGFGGGATGTSATNLGVNAQLQEAARKAQTQSSAIQGGASGLGLLLGLLSGWGK